VPRDGGAGAALRRHRRAMLRGLLALEFIETSLRVALDSEGRPKQCGLIGMAEFNVESDVAGIERNCLECLWLDSLMNPAMCAYCS
jgi:hypothetical protein